MKVRVITMQHSLPISKMRGRKVLKYQPLNLLRHVTDNNQAIFSWPFKICGSTTVEATLSVPKFA